MSEMVPKSVRDGFRQTLWAKADTLDWRRRPALERASIYENWAKDKEIGGVLAHYMDTRKVRVYIKDTLMKPYQRARSRDDFGEVLAALGLDPVSTEIRESFSQPHGRALLDGRVICWGGSRDWKSIIFSVFERAHVRPPSTPFAAVLMDTGVPIDDQTFAIATEAGRRLGLVLVRRM